MVWLPLPSPAQVESSPREGTVTVLEALTPTLFLLSLQFPEPLLAGALSLWGHHGKSCLPPASNGQLQPGSLLGDLESRAEGHKGRHLVRVPASRGSALIPVQMTLVTVLLANSCFSFRPWCRCRHFFPSSFKRQFHLPLFPSFFSPTSRALYH